MAKKRIFAAIDVSNEAKENISAYIKTLQGEFRDLRVRWERPEKLHVTIHFAGDLDDGELAAFEKRVSDSASISLPFTITVDRIGGFVKRRSRANVLWLGLESQGALEKLAENLDENNSRFTPHLTIVRLKDAKLARDLIDRHLEAKFEPVKFEANQIVVYESQLLKTGSVYYVISTHQFAEVS